MENETIKGINKKKLIISISICVLICFIGFLIAWSATKEDRTRNELIKNIEFEISEMRAKIAEDDHYNHSMFFRIYNDYETDEKFIDFLCSQIRTMCQNQEYILLHEFVFEIILGNDCENDAIINTLVDCFKQASSLETAIDIREAFDPIAVGDSSFSYWNKIQPLMTLSRDSEPLSSYIEKNGTRSYTTKVGEGYYANYNNSSSSEIIGLPSSPLSENESNTYFGDFRCHRWWGTRLNAWYEEEHYSGRSYYFRDNYIPFSPDDGDLVWSGDYLFCFAPDGMLIDYSHLELNN